MDIRCYRLHAGDVLRYSSESLIECYSSSFYNGIDRFFSKNRIVSIDSYHAELENRCDKQEISNDYFERISSVIRERILLADLERLRPDCFDIPGGNAARFSNGMYKELIKVNNASCEVIESLECPVSFQSSLKSYTDQSRITNDNFKRIKKEANAMINEKRVGIDKECSTKIQIELF